MLFLPHGYVGSIINYGSARPRVRRFIGLAIIPAIYFSFVTTPISSSEPIRALNKTKTLAGSSKEAPPSNLDGRNEVLNHPPVPSVIPSCPPITISPTSLPGATAGATYIQGISATGVSGSATPSVSAGALPPGLSLTYGGEILGVPTAAGTFNFTITITDNITGCTGSQSYSMQVQLGLTLGPDPGSAFPNATVGSPYSQTVTAVGGTAPYTFSFSGTLPPGLTLSSSGTLSGNPTTARTASFSITVTDASNLTGAQNNIEMASQSSDLCSLAVTTTGDSGVGSMRSAINCANTHSNAANPGGAPDTITFAIPGSGRQSINLSTALPTILDPVIIDGYTQPGTSVNTLPNGENALLLVWLVSNIPDFANGLALHPNADGSTIRGLVITNFQGNGIDLIASSHHTIEGNGIIGNGRNGVIVQLGSRHITIGGTSPDARNVIASNSGNGIAIGVIPSPGSMFTGDTRNIRVGGNFIGTIDGSTPAGNLGNGVFVTNGAHGSGIGFDVAGAGNVISGNQGNGVAMNTFANSNLVYGNYIGTDATGSKRLGNGSNGVRLFEVQNSFVGGGGPGQSNVISANVKNGVAIFSASANNSVSGNRIGTDASGMLNLGNQANGVLLADNAVNNLIGGIDRITPGQCTGACNLIASNTLEGVLISSGSGNTIKENSIYANGQLGIKLLTNDADTNFLAPHENSVCNSSSSGANHLQNYPVLSYLSTSSTSTIIAGTLNSEANLPFTLDFFANDTGSPTGYGQGQTYLGSTQVTTDGACNAEFSVIVPTSISPTQVVTATATNSFGETSEFSNWIGVSSSGTSIPLISSITPNSGGDQGTVTATIYGQNFKPGATVKLSRFGQPDILGAKVNVLPDGLSLTAMFNLTGQVDGKWDVVVSNPNNSSAKLTGAFTIIAGGTAQTWVDIIGRDQIRASHLATRYTVVYGNRGTVDGLMVPLTIGNIPLGAQVTLGFNVSPLPNAPGDPPVPDEIKNLSPIHANSNEQYVTLLIPVVPAGSSNYLTFTIRFNSIPSNSSFTMTAAIGSPLLKTVFSQTGSTRTVLQRGGLSALDLTLEQQQCLKSFQIALIQCVLGFLPLQCLDAFFAKSLSVLAAAYDAATHSGLGAIVFDGAGLIAAVISIVAACSGVVLPPIFKWINCFLSFGSFIAGCWPTIQKIVVTTIESTDPNAKMGSTGATNLHYISGSEPLRYAIYFENKPDATAPAQAVAMTDQLDTTKFDLSTFSLGQIGFGDSTVITPQGGLQSFNTDVDLRPKQNLIVRINAALNSSNGVVTWNFVSIDPATGQPTTDPTAGFLPPNINGTQGEASVLYTVKPKTTVTTGTQINNTATVTFDLNPALNTNTYLNTIDNTPPASHVSALNANQPSVIFNVSWSGTDVASGIRDYTVYVSENGGAYSIWLDHTTQTSALYIGKPGTTYSFFTVATDTADNQEAIKSAAEATTSTASNIQSAIDDASFFVYQHYLDFLDRPPDQSGWDYWTSQISQCGSDALCIHNKRVDVSNAFFYELEYQQTGSYVFRLYRAAFGNNQPFPNPDSSNPTDAKKLPGYAVFAPDRASVVGGASLSQSQIDFATNFVQRDAFLQKYSGSLDGSSFIDALLNTIKNDIGVDLSAQKPSLMTVFNQAGGSNAGRGAVMYRLANDDARAGNGGIDNRALIDAEYNRAFVATQYFGFLKRDSDIGGFSFWLSQINSAPLRDMLKQHAMVCSFITSAEYQQRFGSIVTHTNSECLIER